MTENYLILLFQNAKFTGDLAAQNEVYRLAEMVKKNPSMQLDCGGAYIEVELDGRTQLARMLINLNLPYLSVRNTRTHRGLGYSIHIVFDFTPFPPISGQEKWIRQTANQAIEKMVLEGLGLRGRVMVYTG